MPRMIFQSPNRAACPFPSPRDTLKYWLVTRWITSVLGEVKFVPSNAGHRFTPSGARGPVPAVAVPAGAPAIPSTKVTYQSDLCNAPAMATEQQCSSAAEQQCSRAHVSKKNGEQHAIAS